MGIITIMKQLLATPLLFSLVFSPDEPETVTSDVRSAEEIVAEVLENPEESDTVYETESMQCGRI